MITKGRAKRREPSPQKSINEFRTPLGEVSRPRACGYSISDFALANCMYNSTWPPIDYFEDERHRELTVKFKLT